MLAEQNKQVEPIWRVVEIDETRHWNPEIVAKCGGRILSIYVYDASCRTFCCEITPSYELFLAAYAPRELPEDDAERERVFDDLSQAQHEVESTIYMHCRDVERMTSRDPYGDDEWRTIEWAEELEQRRST
jgi:hypothetical protein